MSKQDQTRLLFAGREWASALDACCDFPASALDGNGKVWLASTAYAGGQRVLRLHSLNSDGGDAVRDLVVPGSTGLGAPAVCGVEAGCVTVCPVEQAGRWRIACFFPKAEVPVFLDAGGTVNDQPAVAAAGPVVYVAWQSNAGGRRAIYAAPVAPPGVGGIVRLSSAEWHNQNPALVSVGDGELFAAWDSIRGDSADIHGVRFRGGAWQAERRLTSDARIERQAALVAHDGAVWMAWQAQSYPGRLVNRIEEQRIVVARLDEDGPRTPAGGMESFSPAENRLVRPELAFDRAGRLWLSYRRSLGEQHGWAPQIRVFDGDAWSEMKLPTRHYGRWRPVALLPLEDRVLWAAQCDDLPVTWDEQGIWPEWRSWIEAGALRPHPDTAPTMLRTEALSMPETDFDLARKRVWCAADLPEQRVEIAGSSLTLLWGDLHDHTDLSVCNRAMNLPGPDVFPAVRDIEALDFCALTNHGYNMDPSQWAYNGEQTRKHHDPDRFITFLGQEWTSEVAPPLPGGIMNRYGHHNLIFLDPYHPQFYDAHDGDISPSDLWAAIGEAEFLCIPHQLACWAGKGKHNVPKQWDFVDQFIQPVAESCQIRGSYEGLGCPYQSQDATPWRGHFLQDAWERGVVIGVIASPDHGGGKGKAGVWAKAKTREAIFEAIRARHTFGTSGAKMSLLFRCGCGMMGDVLPRDTPPVFQVDAACLRPIRRLSILRNNETVHEVTPEGGEIHLTWEDPGRSAARHAWYYVRMSTGEDEWAWSSPIWLGSPDGGPRREAEQVKVIRPLKGCSRLR